MTMPRNRENAADPEVMTLADLRLALDRKERTLRELLARKEALAEELEELGETMQAMLFGSDAAAGRRSPPPRAARKSEAEADAKSEAGTTKTRRRGRPPKHEANDASDAGNEPSIARAGSLQAVIRSVLERVIGPLKVSEIVAAVLQSGYASKSANLNVIVGNRLVQMEDVEKVDRGLYQLKRPAAAPPAEPPTLINVATA
jgi:hypothetical protein